MPAPTIRTSKCSVDAAAEVERAKAGAFMGLVFSMAGGCLTSVMIRALSNSQCNAPFLRGLQNPVAVKGERGDPGQAAAAARTVWPGRPADEADDGGTVWPGLEHRAAGIPGACAEAASHALRCRIEQADLQRPRLAGRDEIGAADDAAAVALSADGDADAGDGEGAALSQRYLRHADNSRILSLRRCVQQQQRH